MYLREIDYDLLCKMKNHIKDGNSLEKQYYTENELAYILFNKDPSINLEATFNYYRQKQLICDYSDNNTIFPGPDGSYYQELTVIGEAIIEQYKLDLETRLYLPKEANRIARESKKEAKRSNLIAFFSIVISIVSLLYAIFSSK